MSPEKVPLDTTYTEGSLYGRTTEMVSQQHQQQHGSQTLVTDCSLTSCNEVNLAQKPGTDGTGKTPTQLHKHTHTGTHPNILCF